jgi:hypothetical protein
MTMRDELARIYAYVGHLLVLIAAILVPGIGLGMIPDALGVGDWAFWLVFLVVCIGWMPVPLVWFLRWQERAEFARTDARLLGALRVPGPSYATEETAEALKARQRPSEGQD